MIQGIGHNYCTVLFILGDLPIINFFEGEGYFWLLFKRVNLVMYSTFFITLPLFALRVSHWKAKLREFFTGDMLTYQLKVSIPFLTLSLLRVASSSCFYHNYYFLSTENLMCDKCRLQTYRTGRFKSCYIYMKMGQFHEHFTMLLTCQSAVCNCFTLLSNALGAVLLLH